MKRVVIPLLLLLATAIEAVPQEGVDYHSLLLGVNIGGVGTLIASLASLITLRQYNTLNPGKTGRYIASFSAFNFSFLIVLTAFCMLLV